MSETPNSFADGGWFWLTEEGQKKARELAAKSRGPDPEVAKAFQRLFSSPDGSVVLADLKFRTVDQPTWVPGVPDPIHAGFAREGQNSMYRYIVAMMQAAERSTEEGNG